MSGRWRLLRLRRRPGEAGRSAQTLKGVVSRVRPGRGKAHVEVVRVAAATRDRAEVGAAERSERPVVAFGRGWPVGVFLDRGLEVGGEAARGGAGQREG